MDAIKALASDVRLSILNLLSQQMMSVSEIAAELQMQLPTVAANVKILEQAGLIYTRHQPGRRGSQKVCSRTYDRIVVTLPGIAVTPGHDSVEVSMPIGNYKDVDIEGSTCGLASETQIIGLLDDPRSFYRPEHVFAQILWISRGSITYRFANQLPYHVRPTRLEFSAEICSEAPNYNPDWPSDITLWVNDKELGTWTSPGDFGGGRGYLTPTWWLDRYTQYGLLKTWSVTSEGSFVDGVRVSDTTIDQLELVERKVYTVRLGNRPDARYSRGFNLFGRKFGNYDQDLSLRIFYELLDDAPAPVPAPTPAPAPAPALAPTPALALASALALAPTPTPAPTATSTPTPAPVSAPTSVLTPADTRKAKPEIG